VFKTAGSDAKGGWFFTSGWPVIKPDTLLINKVHAESLRLDWLAKTTPPAYVASAIVFLLLITSMLIESITLRTCRGYVLNI
jgi:hypothetical protein